MCRRDVCVCARGAGRPPVAKSAVLCGLFHTEEELRACVRTYVRRACVRAYVPSVRAVRACIRVSLSLSLFIYIYLSISLSLFLSVYECARECVRRLHDHQETDTHRRVFNRVPANEDGRESRSIDRPIDSLLYSFHDLHGDSAMRKETDESRQGTRKGS